MSDTRRTVRTSARPGATAAALALLLGAGAVVPVAAETLAEAFEVAQQADARLAASRQQVVAAEAGVAAAQALAQPQVAVDALYQRLSDEPAFRVHLAPLPAMALPVAPDRGWVYRAGVTLPLYTAGRLGSVAHAAEATQAAAQADDVRTRQDLRLVVAESYVAVLRAGQALALADSGVAMLQAHERDVTQLFAQGLVARNDLLAARSAAANAQQDRIRAETLLAIARAAYNRQLGRALDAPVALDDLDPPAPETDATDTGRALSAPPPERAELVALARQSEALRHQADAARAAGRPQVLLSGGYQRLQNPYLVRDALWSVGVGLHWTLFDGGLQRGQGDALQARAQALDALRREAQSQIALQVRAAALQVDESRRRLAVTALAVEQADENLRVARDRYQSGVGSATEVLDAEALRQRSRSNHVNARYDQVLAGLRLQRARGLL